MKRRTAWMAGAIVATSGAAWGFAGCSSSGSGVTEGVDRGGGADATGTVVPDTGAGDSAPASDASPRDASGDTGPQDAGPPHVTGMAIVSQHDGGALAATPGDALPLKVVFTFSDGTTEDLPAGTNVSWISPSTVTAQDPYDAGPSSVLPDAGAQPTAFFIANPYRPERSDYPGVLFVITSGAAGDAGVQVTAQLADGGTIGATVAIGEAPAGDPDAGGQLFSAILVCRGCHGANADGTPPVLGPDGGVFLVDGGPVYNLGGGQFPYPAPGLSNVTPEGGSPYLAADPAWSAALLGMAAQGDIDNYGVALRKPMPDWLETSTGAGTQLTGKDFADIYAWLRTQTQ